MLIAERAALIAGPGLLIAGPALLIAGPPLLIAGPALLIASPALLIDRPPALFGFGRGLIAHPGPTNRTDVYANRPEVGGSQRRSTRGQQIRLFAQCAA